MARQGDNRPNHAMTAALIGGAAAATAGAFWSPGPLARRTGAGEGKHSPIMETAATACELAHGEAASAGRRR